MIFSQPNSRLHSDILEDGDYYVFSKQGEGKICLGYLYHTWCGSPYGMSYSPVEPYGMYMHCSPVELGKPLPLVQVGDSHHDRGQLKTFKFDSRNILLVDDVCNRAMIWLNYMQRNLKYPHIDESTSCKPMVIQVTQGVLFAHYEKDEFLKVNRLRSL